MAELKPYPFRGGEAVLHGEYIHWVSCPECGTEMQIKDTREEAIEAWNRRTGE